MYRVVLYFPAWSSMELLVQAGGEDQAQQIAEAWYAKHGAGYPVTGMKIERLDDSPVVWYQYRMQP